jgi:hypothetical protein
MPKIDPRRHAPVIVIVVLVAAPLAIWAATSGGSGSDKKQGLIAERSVSLTGAPEIILSIAGNVQVKSGASTVKVKCTDADGNVIIDTTQPWPFIEEPGYPYAHVHQGGPPEKIEGARHCSVLGTDARLEADVK